MRAQSFTRRALLTGLLGLPAVRASEWPGFRGDGRSLAAEGDWPLRWSGEEGVQWRLDLPDYGQSSPVVWGDRAYLTAIQGANKETLATLAVEVASGRLLWRREIDNGAPGEISDMISKAAPTAATDAEGVYVFFETGDLLAYDRQGGLRWRRQLVDEYGPFGGRHGIGSSLRLVEAGLLVLAAHDGPSYLLCVDPATGQNRWKTDRPSRVSWSTPTVMRQGEREVILVSAGERVDAYSATDGAGLWFLDGLKGAFIPSPTPLSDDLVLIGSSDKGSNWAIRLPDGDGEPEIAWKAPNATSYFNSPLAYRGRAYLVSKAGVGYCVNAATGAELWTERLPGPCWASPVGAADRVYFFGVDGETTIVSASDEFRLLASNRFEGEDRVYGVAAVNGSFLVRRGRSLLRI